jgi:hypothetical protein
MEWLIKVMQAAVGLAEDGRLPARDGIDRPHRRPLLPEADAGPSHIGVNECRAGL